MSIKKRASGGYCIAAEIYITDGEFRAAEQHLTAVAARDLARGATPLQMTTEELLAAWAAMGITSYALKSRIKVSGGATAVAA